MNPNNIPCIQTTTTVTERWEFQYVYILGRYHADIECVIKSTVVYHRRLGILFLKNSQILYTILPPWLYHLRLKAGVPKKIEGLYHQCFLYGTHHGRTVAIFCNAKSRDSRIKLLITELIIFLLIDINNFIFDSYHNFYL